MTVAGPSGATASICRSIGSCRAWAAVRGVDPCAPLTGRQARSLRCSRSPCARPPGRDERSCVRPTRLRAIDGVGPPERPSNPPECPSNEHCVDGGSGWETDGASRGLFVGGRPGIGPKFSLGRGAASMQSSSGAHPSPDEHDAAWRGANRYEALLPAAPDRSSPAHGSTSRWGARICARRWLNATIGADALASPTVSDQ